MTNRSTKKAYTALGITVLITGCGGSEASLGSSESALGAPLYVDTTSDPFGSAQTASPSPIDQTAHNPFFANLGTNGRTCGTCHVESLGWTLTPGFAKGLRDDNPLFLFDGSDCLPPGLTNRSPLRNSKEMRNYANVRIDLPIPTSANYTLASYTDPFSCPTPPSASNLRMYRRPLPTANTAFLATVMWDARENVTATIPDDLRHQANDATRGHAQALTDLSEATKDAMFTFETGTFFAQKTVSTLDLESCGARGGARYLDTDVLPGFFIGQNDPFLPGFDSHVFNLFAAWEPGAYHAATALDESPVSGTSSADSVDSVGSTESLTTRNARRAAIGRGELLFNTKVITIENVPGLNGPEDASQAPISGFCGTCHDAPNIGHHSVSLAIDIGITAVSPTFGLDVSHLPTYTFQENGTGRTVTLTDGGRGLITGRFSDLGKTKGPILRGLAARAPYFHNGSARDLPTVVAFYDARFHLGLTTREKSDLAAFLSAL